MSNIISFVKIEATGNDFVLFHASDLEQKERSAHLIRTICHRRFGIGADGVIILDETRMHYFNANGSVGEMCGNGLRAATRFAYATGRIKAGEMLLLQADDGAHRVLFDSEEKIDVEILNHQNGKDRIYGAADPAANVHYLKFLNTGVPHVVFEVSDGFDNLDVKKIGRTVRNDLTFAPEGTNVNFIQIVSSSSLRIRTYERGVEAETLSCGTGSVAAVLTALELDRVHGSNIQLETRGGILRVRIDKNELFLSGPAHISFSGQLDLDLMNRKNLVD